MRLRFAGLFSAVVLLAPIGALACNVGDATCNNGYKYVCTCWTATGCNYEYSGLCHHDGGNPSPLAGRALLGRYAYLSRTLFGAAPAR